jgi:polysaccharide export outer membrane protein
MENNRYFLASFIALVTILACSCSSTKKLIYVQDASQASTPAPLAIGNYTEPVIRPDDILAININTTDPNATLSINSKNGVYVNGGTSTNGSSNPLAGYLVDKDGNVDIPVLGTIKLGGLTTFEAKKSLKALAKKSFENPIVDVRFSNFKITVLGEVSHPAAYILPNEQVTIFDALGYAGDLTIYGRRTNVLLIRKGVNGNDVSVRLDMTKKDFLNSPYYYLKQNDVLYVEPLKTKVLNNDSNLIKYLSLAATLLTAGILAKRYW